MALKAHLDTAPPQLGPPQLGPSQLGPSQPVNRIEGRRHARRSLRLETSGNLPDGGAANVTVHNLSAAGLLMETDLALGVGEVLAVDLPRIGPVGAQIVWQSQQLFGCAFEQALGEAALAAAQLRGSAPSLKLPASSRPTSAAPSLAGPSLTPLSQAPAMHGVSSRGAGESFGARIRQLRREKGLTLAQVAAGLGVSKPSVWAWEKGKAKPLPERAAAIADVLGVTKDALHGCGSSNSGAALVEEYRLRLAEKFGVNARNIRIIIEI